MLKRLVVGGLGLGVAAWAGIAGVDSTTRDDAGQITVQGELGAFVTKLGDCINDDAANTKTVSTVTGLPCDQPHNWQVIYKGEIYLAEFVRSEVKSKTQAICSAEADKLITSYLNVSDKEFDQYENAGISYFSPSPESWENGDRTIDCLIGSYTEFYTGSLLD